MKPHYFLPLLFCLLFLGCEDAFNCIIPREPELPNKSFPVASTEGYYYSDLRVGITNEPRDEDYDYYFDVRGLPDGMDFFVDYRTISIEGTPATPGTYRVTIYLDVDGPFRESGEEPDFLCNYSTTKTYILIVE